jgi:2-oxoglutarate dehydrogenase E2 component (dihydrolipoamide succinyltransferase)
MLKGMHTIKDRPVVVDGQIVIRPIMVVALTYDHRLLDGREAVTFLGKNLIFCIYIIPLKSKLGLGIVKVKEYLEDPAKMLLAA